MHQNNTPVSLVTLLPVATRVIVLGRLQRYSIGVGTGPAGPAAAGPIFSKINK